MRNKEQERDRQRRKDEWEMHRAALRRRDILIEQKAPALLIREESRLAHVHKLRAWGWTGDVPFLLPEAA